MSNRRTNEVGGDAEQSARSLTVQVGTDGKATLERPAGCSDELIALLHSDIVGGSVYSGQVANVAAEGKVALTAFHHAASIVKRMNPTDPLEEMLAMQALWTHGRIARLIQLSTERTCTESIRVINEAIDRATNTYRRLMLALAEYRRPARAGVLMSVAQLNAAGQQIVQNAVAPLAERQNAANEEGSPDEQHKARPALPAHAEWSGFASLGCPAGEAVGAQHGAEERSG